MKTLSQVFTLLLLLGLIACGGGGDGEDIAPNLSPVAVAPADFDAFEESTVVLDGGGSLDTDGSIVSYSWSQTSGSQVIINQPNTSMASFVAPMVDSDTNLSFELSVIDNLGATSSDSVTVRIKPDLPPQVVIPSDFQVVELTQVILDGSQSTDDVQIASYLWQQVSGDNVVLTSADTSVATFVAPAFNANQATVLTFRLIVTDSAGAAEMGTVDVTIVDTPPIVVLSGVVTFDFVPHSNSTNGLDYNNISQRPIREATVDLLDSGGTTTLQSTTTDSSGNYSFDVEAQSSYIVRVKAELARQGTPGWDFSVVDNTNGQALYAMDSVLQAVQSQSVTLNVNAASGWTGSSYGAPRVAAPFAILDAVYQAKEKILSVDSTVVMPALNLNWSVNNVPVSGDPASGQIGTSSWNGTEIFILGSADNDTDEYDHHVIIHEWGHYFEDKFSRADSIGGPHSEGDKLDMRVALGEGFGNALSGIVTDNPSYQDSLGAGQSVGFEINVEENPTSNRGWYSEFSVQSLLYDFYDSNSDGADNITLGFAPIYRALTNGERTTEAMTSIFSLGSQLKVESPASSTAIDALLATQNIIAADDFGSTETNNGGDARNLPIYKSISIGGPSVEVCSFDTNDQFNKLGNRQFIEFDIASGGSYTFTANGQSAGDDPDIRVHKQGVINFVSEANGDESTTQTLSSGKYILEAYEFSNVQGSGKDTCIDVSIAAS